MFILKEHGTGFTVNAATGKVKLTGTGAVTVSVQPAEVVAIKVTL